MGGVSEMSADELEMPESSAVSCAWKSDGMRVVVMYYVNADGFIVRFDTIYEGAQYNIAYRLNTPYEEGARALVPTALKDWADQRWARGRIIWFANDPRL